MAGGLEAMIKTAIILPDVHMTDKLPKDYLPVRDFIKSYKPNKVIILGDFMDVASLSAWDYDKKRIMEGKRFMAEVALANEELDFLQSCVKDKEDPIFYIEGNHEDRVNRYLDKNPEMEGMIEIPQQLKLKERGIQWFPYVNQDKKPLKVGDMYFIHGMYTNQYHANKHLQKLGCNVCYGHTHNSQSAMQNMAFQKSYMAYGLGTLGDKSPDYLRGKPGNWLNQFALFEWDTENGHFNLYPVNVINGKFQWNGKQYGKSKPTHKHSK